MIEVDFTRLYMDRLIIFNNGEIIADGTHIDLMQSNLYYKNLWDAQTNIL